MSANDDDLRLLDESITLFAERLGVPISAEQRKSMIEAAGGDYWIDSLARMSASESLERKLYFNNMAICLFHESRGPTPVAITLDVLHSTPDSELPNTLYDFICDYLAESDGDLLKLPQGLQIVYLLYALDGEVSNGGFYQFFTNSSGEFAAETLDACTRAGWLQRRKVLEQAIVFWEPVRTQIDAAEGDPRKERAVRDQLQLEIEPKLDELASAYYEVCEVEPVHPFIVQHARSNPEEFLLDGITSSCGE